LILFIDLAFPTRVSLIDLLTY